MISSPLEAPIEDVVQALLQSGFRIVREKNYIAMLKEAANEMSTLLTLPNRRHIKAATLRVLVQRTGIAPQTFANMFRLREA